MRLTASCATSLPVAALLVVGCAAALPPPPTMTPMPIAVAPRDPAVCPRVWPAELFSGARPSVPAGPAGCAARVDLGGGVYELEGPDELAEPASSRCYSTVQHPQRLARFDAAGKVAWTAPVVSGSSDAGGLAADGMGAYIVVLNPFATCAIVRGFPAEGHLPWERSVGCLVDAHSAYQNDVVLGLERDRLLVWGSESGGLYLMALDRHTGEPLCERHFDPPAR